MSGVDSVLISLLKLKIVHYIYNTSLIDLRIFYLMRHKKKSFIFSPFSSITHLENKLGLILLRVHILYRLCSFSYYHTWLENKLGFDQVRYTKIYLMYFYHNSKFLFYFTRRLRGIYSGRSVVFLSSNRLMMGTDEHDICTG